MPTFDELHGAYRAAIKREVQLRKENEELTDLVLHLKGRLMTFTQHVDFRLIELARERERRETANDVATVKVYG